jgi:hypothetical protein
MSPNARLSGAEQLEREEIRLRVRRSEIVGTVIVTAIRWVCGAAGVFFAARAVQHLAGLNTLADIRIMGGLQVSVAVSWAAGAGGVAYGWRQRALRHNVNATLGTRVSELEKELDKRRSSSKLTKKGTTNPENQL